MQTIHQIYIDGAFVTPHGTETIDIINPTSGTPLARRQRGEAGVAGIFANRCG